MSVMMNWILSFASEDGQNQYQNAKLDLTLCLKKNPVIFVLQIISGYADYI